LAKVAFRFESTEGSVQTCRDAWYAVRPEIAIRLTVSARFTQIRLVEAIARGTDHDQSDHRQRDVGLQADDELHVSPQWRYDQPRLMEHDECN
jgi:hypothetical protein